MHTYFVTRGVNHMVQQWITFMQAQQFPWKRYNLNVCECSHGKMEHKEKEAECLFTKCPCLKFQRREEIISMQGGLRPIQFWEYVHPRESLKTVLAMQHSTSHNSTLLDEVDKMRPEMKPLAWAMRKVLGLKPIPSKETIMTDPTQFVPGFRIPDSNMIFGVNNVPIDGVGIYPIGIKEDVYGENESFGYEQEMI